MDQAAKPATLVGAEEQDPAALLKAARLELEQAREALREIRGHAAQLYATAARHQQNTLARGFDLLTSIAEDALEAA